MDYATLPVPEPLNRSARGRGLLIVAHPDDETIFCGGALSKLNSWHWTVLCATHCDPRYNSRRREELEKACRFYESAGSRVSPVMLGVRREAGRFRCAHIRSAIESFLKQNSPFDFIATHNSRGEYGHPTHILVHKAVTSLVTKDLYCFFLPGFITRRYQTLPARAEKDALCAVALRKKEARIKGTVLAHYMRGSQRTNFTRLKILCRYSLTRPRELYHKYN